MKINHLDGFREAWAQLGRGRLDEDSKGYLLFLAGVAFAARNAMVVCDEHRGERGCDLGECSSAISNRIRDEILPA